MEEIRQVAELTRQHRHAEALAMMTHYFDESRQLAGQQGVRLSFGLGVWADLAEHYPPARDELVATRDRGVERLLSGTDDQVGRGSPPVPPSEDFVEVATINEFLGLDTETCDLYRELQRRHPEQARQCAATARPVLERCGQFREEDE